VFGCVGYRATAAAAEGDRFCQDVFHRAGKHLGRMVRTCLFPRHLLQRSSGIFPVHIPPFNPTSLLTAWLRHSTPPPSPTSCLISVTYRLYNHPRLNIDTFHASKALQLRLRTAYTAHIRRYLYVSDMGVCDPLCSSHRAFFTSLR
jgi:hypothetical protein